MKENAGNKVCPSVKSELPKSIQTLHNIEYFLAKNSFITLKIFNQNMQEIVTLAEGEKSIGLNKIIFYATGLPAGFMCASLRRSVQYIT